MFTSQLYIRFLSFGFHQNSNHKHRMTRYGVITYVAAYNINFELREDYECIYGQNVLCDGCSWFRIVYIGGLPVSRIFYIRFVAGLEEILF